MESTRTKLAVFAFFFLSQIINQVIGHGRLMDPPSRNAMWRFGFQNPVNYNDNELFCGGYAVQWVENDGKCGICGDAYHIKKPRPHEGGGEFANGIITKHYIVGQDINIEVELTANHQGYFEMYLCPHNDPKLPETQKCFDKYPLYLSGTKDVQFIIPDNSEKKAIFQYKVTLPPSVTCSQCVIQWNYYTGNMWGTCDNGTEAVGCGKPETFKNCADVNIVTSSSGGPPIFVKPFQIYYEDYRASDEILPLIIRSQVCRPSKFSRGFAGMKNWCLTNCFRYPSNCPELFCECPNQCDAIGELKDKKGADVYCMDKCLVHNSVCPENRCTCY